MQRKHFVAFALMDRENLRSNIFHHSSIIFLYANCDENGNITSPLFIDEKRKAYSFYSHPVPFKKTFSEEKITFFTQYPSPNLRLCGSYGELREEKIHDLTYGKGLTGIIFERSESKINGIKAEIDNALAAQKEFLSQADNDIDREELYRNYSRQQFLKLVKEGVSVDEAQKRTHNLRPIPEFNSFPLFGGQKSCKVVTLDLIANSYDKNDPTDKVVLDYINYLRYGSLPDNRFFTFPRFLTSFIPRLTPGLEEFIFHSTSDKWETQGENSKYPYCEWDKIKENEIFAVSAGNYYIDQKAYMQPLLTPDKECRNVILNLKAIGRICEINIADEVFKIWHAKINHFLKKMASAANAGAQHFFSVSANEYLGKLIASEQFKNDIVGKVPENLQPLLDGVYRHYEPLEQDKDEVNRTWVLA